MEARVKAKRYYITSQMIKHKFRKVGPFYAAPMGEICNNWERGNLKVERLNACGGVHLHIKKDNHIIFKFDISPKNENRESRIAAFEAALERLVKEEFPQLTLSYKERISKIKLIDDEIEKLKAIKFKLAGGAEVTSNEMDMLKKHNII